MAFTVVTVTGSFKDADGGMPQDVRVTGQASFAMENAGVIVANSLLVGKMDDTGHLVNPAGQPFVAMATDDAGTTPAGVEYEWTLEIDGIPLVRGRGPLAHASPTVDLFSLLDFA